MTAPFEALLRWQQVIVGGGFSPASFTGSNPGVSGLTITGMTTPKATLQNSGC